MRHLAFFRFSVVTLLVLLVSTYMGWFNYYHTKRATFTLVIFTFNMYVYALYWIYTPLENSGQQLDRPDSGRGAK